MRLKNDSRYDNASRTLRRDNASIRPENNVNTMGSKTTLHLINYGQTTDASLKKSMDISRVFCFVFHDFLLRRPYSLKSDMVGKKQGSFLDFLLSFPVPRVFPVSSTFSSFP